VALRSLRAVGQHLVAALETFRTLNVGFISLQEQLDTATPIGQAMFTIIGAMAQLERDIIRERVKAGLDRAKARGIRLGRPRVPMVAEELVALREQRLSVGEMARRLRCSRSTVRRYLSTALAHVGADQHREARASIASPAEPDAWAGAPAIAARN
jgi:DNA invertase Pin-like site-specific DNA recombinase